MPINAGYEFINAEKAFLDAKTIEEKIIRLEEMIRVAPSHKGAENLRAELRTRLKKLKEKAEKASKSGKSSRKAIKKEGFQIVLVGFPGSGKSSLLSKLTNARPKISPSPFNTKEPIIGTLDYQGIKAQIVDLPSIGSEYFDVGIVNTSDLIILVITNLNEINKIIPLLSHSSGKNMMIINKSDLMNSNDLRKLEETLKSKKLPAIAISCENNYNIESLKELILKNMNIIRVYTKEPGKPSTNDPVVLPFNSTVKDVAESIRKGFSLNVIESRVTGPSSKFPNQKVGLSHQLKDLDTVEFHTR